MILLWREIFAVDIVTTTDGRELPPVDEPEADAGGLCCEL